ncbi:MAG: winged helix-turn-helix domain-containing protein [Thermoleophilaceae bacterium]|nr:winged helix-turn-helix domain-containing protein [Thermoleophilaceae bacterium]
MLEFRLLGPVEALVGGSVLSLGGARQRGVLAILLLHAGEVVPSERLVDLIWGESPPPTAATALQGYVSQLRKAIEPDRPAGTASRVIVTSPPGYLVRLEPGQLDLDRFEEIVERGRAELAAGRLQPAADTLAEAIGLWRGPPLANVRDERFAGDAIRRLEELRVAAIEDHVDARVALGHHRQVVAELEGLIAAHPLRERLRAQLMLALYRSDRQAEALDAFTTARRMLVDELGIEPGDQLRMLHDAILRQDASLDLPVPTAAGTAPLDKQVTVTARSRPSRRAAAAVIGVSVLAAGGLAAALGLFEGGPDARPAAPANSLVLLDPGDGTTRATFDVGGTPTSVAVGDGAAWVLNADDQTISRIDGRTRAVKTFGSGGVPTDLAVGGDALWVANGKRTRAQFVGPVATSVVRLDASSTAVRGAVALPAPRGFTSNVQQDHLAVAPDAVWAVNPDASVSRIDPRTTERVAVVRGVQAAALGLGDEGLWALELDSSLARIDVHANRVDRRVRVAATSLSAVAVGAGAVWAAAPYDGTVWRVDTKPYLVQRTIDVGFGVSDVAYGMGSVWALNSLRGTVTRIDPKTNRVTKTVTLGNTPRQIAVGAGGVWLTVAGSAGAPLPAAGTPARGAALPASTCGRVFYGGKGAPQRLIVSDMPLRGRDLPTLQMSEAIAYVLRQRGFRAGRFSVGYQACDDSTAQTGIFDQDKCAANAKLYAATPAVIGEVGPYNSGCALVQIPIANRAPRGPLAMISPTNSDVGLTRASPITPEGLLGTLYPSGRRNYVRVYPREDVQAAAAAVHARDLGAKRVAVLSDGGYGEPWAFNFSRAARRLGMTVVLARRWRPQAQTYAKLVAAVGRARPAAVYVSGLLDSNAGRLIKDLHARLPSRIALIGNEGLLPVSRLFGSSGAAARGMYLTSAELPVERLPRAGRHFVSQFAATQGSRPVHPQSVYAAQAADALLDAIAASDGSRASVLAALRARRGGTGLIGSLRFDAAGDVTSAPIVILRARRGDGSPTVLSTDGADVAGVIDVPSRLLR